MPFNSHFPGKPGLSGVFWKVMRKQSRRQRRWKQNFIPRKTTRLHLWNVCKTKH